MTITIHQRTDGKYSLTITQEDTHTISVHEGLFGAVRRLTGQLWGKGVRVSKMKEAA